MKYLTYTEKDTTGIITFMRPKALNALNTEMFHELDSILDHLETNNHIRCVILTGEGKAFIAGADIAEMKGKSPDEAAAFSLLGQNVMNRIEQSAKPFIGALNGFTLGGGLELALSCHFLLAADNARFSAPEVNLGLIPGFGGTQRLARAIGPNNARYYLYTASMFDAEEAYRMGLIQGISAKEELMNKALSIAETIASKGPRATHSLSAIINTGWEAGIKAGYDEERKAFASLFNTEAQEGMSAFLEKRKPQWQ